MKCVDPTALTTAERFAELAEILAAGVQRYFARECKVPKGSGNSHERLAALGPVEAQCGCDALSPKSREPAR